MFSRSRVVRSRRLQYGLFAVSIVVTMLIQAVAPAFAQVRVTLPVRVPEVAASDYLYRVQVTLRHQGDWARLAEWGVTVLNRDGELAATVLVDQV